MGNSYFLFRQFVIRQNRTAMKVGTDGVVLGAWANAPNEPCRILDVGTGTGIIAIMMAQRYPLANVLGIDIEPEAVLEAKENVADSPFADRLEILLQDVLTFEDGVGFDAIVCNPPYYFNTTSQISPEKKRNVARQISKEDFQGIIRQVVTLLKPNGLFSVIVPSQSYNQLITETTMQRLCIARKTVFRSHKDTSGRGAERYLIEFRKHPVNEIINEQQCIYDSPNVYSRWYTELTNQFYL